MAVGRLLAFYLLIEHSAEREVLLAPTVNSRTPQVLPVPINILRVILGAKTDVCKRRQHGVLSIISIIARRTMVFKVRMLSII